MAYKEGVQWDGGFNLPDELGVGDIHLENHGLVDLPLELVPVITKPPDGIVGVTLKAPQGLKSLVSHVFQLLELLLVVVDFMDNSLLLFPDISLFSLEI